MRYRKRISSYTEIYFCPCCQKPATKLSGLFQHIEFGACEQALDGGAIGNLANYLHVERSGSNTVLHVSSNGGFVSGYNAGAEDQTIVLNNVDLTASSTLTSQQVIQELLNNNRLAVDP